MSEALTEIDDPVTATLMEAVNEARILLASEAHRKDLAEIAAATNEMLRLDARRVDLQKAIGERNAVYLKAEHELGRHLAGKIGGDSVRDAARAIPLGGSASVTPTEVEDRVPELSMRRRADSVMHAANCAVGFGDPCDCQ